MARVTFDIGLRNIRGSVGDLVFRHYGAYTIVSRKPKRTTPTPSTPAQKVQQGHFLEGVDYGNLAKEDPELWAAYVEKARAQRKKRVSAWSLAVKDRMNPPTVEEIDASGYAGSPGEVIVIWAVDDFKVTGVDVVLTDGDGVVLEEGPAEGDGRWAYTATVPVPPGTTVRIAATARDHPGNTHTLETDVEVAGRTRTASPEACERRRCSGQMNLF